MNMKSVAGVIHLVKSLEEAVQFYDAIGFEFKKHVPGISDTAYLNGFWIELLLEDKVVTKEFKEDANAPLKGAGQYLHINVEDVDAFHKTVLEKGLKPSGPPQDFPWGHREFVLEDPAGYKLVFFSTLNLAKLGR